MPTNTVRANAPTLPTIPYPLPSSPSKERYPLFQNLHPLPVSPTPRGVRLEDIPVDITTADGLWTPRDCMNLDPPPPAGWYSIPHWVALTEWWVFPCIEGEAWEVICGDWFGHKFLGKAEDAAEEEGFTPLEWPAPPKLQAEGIPTVQLFPDPILRDLFRCL